jgi:hypothetical protein
MKLALPRLSKFQKREAVPELEDCCNSDNDAWAVQSWTLADSFQTFLGCWLSPSKESVCNDWCAKPYRNWLEKHRDPESGLLSNPAR